MDGIGHPQFADARSIIAVADCIDVPVFVLDVSAPPDLRFTFRHFNACLQRMSGMSIDLVIGKTPSEVLPPRSAQTVEQNYRTCAERRSSYRYEEVLDLPGGRRWWETVLSPVFDDNGVLCQIVGVPFDITARRVRAESEARALARMLRASEDLRVYTETAAQSLEEPLDSLSGMLEELQDGFLDLGDRKIDLVRNCMSIALNARMRRDEIVDRMKRMQIGKTEWQPVDFDHLCRDLVALADPDARMAIRHFGQVVITDRLLLQLGLQGLLDDAVARGPENVSIAIEPDHGRNGHLVLSVSDDGQPHPETGAALSTGAPSIPTLSYMAEARGGRLEDRAPFFASGRTRALILPGRMS